eukprot:CAMPEP_0119546440 /NCGR_PEP_ID=MMETSP1352-20130426/865_1 /TAXON_ID=265584 /ORGANISM="Stauroneis constricta, Strain CCMP1120" /LENGTH=172 /DNA_ID=CAMNT_0007591147 /DNA_START=286 /DNA_END=800 /DNA_ORIENTATION=+
MALTEEQRERIRKNRERALDIQRKRKLERVVEKEKQNQRNESQETEKRQKTIRNVTQEDGKDEVGDEEMKILQLDVLEQFEENASPWVTKKEAMKMYCLPQGTLAICEVEERQNPHHKGWTPMKMFNRSEIRRRARKRFGGLQGLLAERTRREENRLLKDMEKAWRRKTRRT